MTSSPPGAATSPAGRQPAAGAGGDSSGDSPLSGRATPGTGVAAGPARDGASREVVAAGPSQDSAAGGKVIATDPGRDGAAGGTGAAGQPTRSMLTLIAGIVLLALGLALAAVVAARPS